MAALSKASATAVFDLKSATLTVLAVVLKTLNLHELAHAMSLRFDDSPGFFDHEPACLDLSAVRDVGEVPDFEDLLALLRHHRQAHQHRASGLGGLIRRLGQTHRQAGLHLFG